MTRALPAVIALAMAVYALIDCLQTDAALVRGPRRGAWLVAILLLPVVGPLAWLLAGRPRRSAPPRRPARSQPVVPPDDDPTFLAQMREIDAEHEKLLKTWESDLRRREEEMRRQRDRGEDDDPRMD